MKIKLTCKIFQSFRPRLKQKLAVSGVFFSNKPSFKFCMNTFRKFSKTSRKAMGILFFLNSLKNTSGFINGIQPDGKNQLIEYNSTKTLSKIHSYPELITPKDVSLLAYSRQPSHPLRSLSFHMYRNIGSEKFNKTILEAASTEFKITAEEFRTFAASDLQGNFSRKELINRLNTPEIIRTLSDDEKNLILEMDSLLTSFKELLLVKTILLKNSEILTNLSRPPFESDPNKRFGGDIFLSKNGEKILTEIKWVGFNTKYVGRTIIDNFKDTNDSLHNFSGKKLLLVFSNEKTLEASHYVACQNLTEIYKLNLARVNPEDLLSFASSSPFSFSKEDLNLINNPKYLFFPHSNLIDDSSSKNFSRPFFSTLSNRDFDGVLKEIASPSDF